MHLDRRHAEDRSFLEEQFREIRALIHSPMDRFRNV
jgi:hypothetical protein